MQHRAADTGGGGQKAPGLPPFSEANVFFIRKTGVAEREVEEKIAKSDIGRRVCSQ